jgi:hypothetical protein
MNGDRTKIDNRGGKKERRKEKKNRKNRKSEKCSLKNREKIM